jgi:predicted dehydrogenase
MPRSRIRICLIGCGFYAQNHLLAWNDLKSEGAELVGVCDLDRKKAAAAAEKFGARAFADAAAMLDELKPDAVDITTQMAAHRALARLAAERGIAAIVQKPLAPSWSDCVAIVETAGRHGTFLAVHENFRFQTPMMRVRQVLASGAIGTANWARIAFRTGYDVYRTQPYFLTEERLAILDVGIHVLDLARVFLGEVEHVFCETQRRNPRLRAKDTATMMLKHRSGAVSLVECTYESRKLPDPFPETLLEIEGERGAIVVEAGLTMRVTSDGAVREEKIDAPLLPWTSRPWHVSQESVVHTNRHMLEALKAGCEAETSGADNLRTYALVEAAYASAASGRAERPPVC